MKVKVFKNLGVFILMVSFSVSCGSLNIPSDSAESQVSASDTKTVSGQIQALVSVSESDVVPGTTPEAEGEEIAERESSTTFGQACDIEAGIVARAVPASGVVVDVDVDQEGFFELILLASQEYSILFYQGDLLCATLLNSDSGEPSLVGRGRGEFDFGRLDFDGRGKLKPEHNCERFFDEGEEFEADDSDDDDSDDDDSDDDDSDDDDSDDDDSDDDDSDDDDLDDDV